MVQHADDEIILQETEKENLNVKNETHENSDDEVDEYELYEIYLKYHFNVEFLFRMLDVISKVKKVYFDGIIKYPIVTII